MTMQIRTGALGRRSRKLPLPFGMLRPQAMSETTKVPVLVTGGAGYIGSHAVLALRDAGWPVAVLSLIHI